MSTPTFGDIGRLLQGVMRASFGPGALGRIGTVALGAMVVMGVIGIPLAFRQPLFALAPVAAVLVVVCVYFKMAFAYADKYPQFAAMDGAQMVRVMSNEGAVKRIPGAPPIDVESTPVQNPQVLIDVDQSGRDDV